MANTSKYRLVNYFDVWGNEADGWEINNLCVEFDDLTISDDATDKEILEYLKMIRFLNTSDMRKLYVDSSMYDGVIEIFERKGMKPICRLETIY